MEKTVTSRAPATECALFFLFHENGKTDPQGLLKVQPKPATEEGA